VAYSVENIVNMALDAIGYSRHIADIYEGSPAARVALEIYGQTRDELLQFGDWPFAQREVAAAAVVGQTPPTPWTSEYQWPADCLRLLYVRPGPLTGGARSNDPQPVLFQIWNDNRPATPVLAILTDQVSAILMYVGRVTDPGTWTPNFVKALVAALAEKMAFMLPKDAQLGAQRAAMAEKDKIEGMAVNDMTIAPTPEAMAAAAGASMNGRQR
jgi:hypothetical protein